MKWITREKVKVDRAVCPWIIKKFIDPHAEFIFLPQHGLGQYQRRGDYDVPSCELGHHGEDVSFNFILRNTELLILRCNCWARLFARLTRGQQIPTWLARGFADRTRFRCAWPERPGDF